MGGQRRRKTLPKCICPVNNSFEPSRTAIWQFQEGVDLCSETETHRMKWQKYFLVVMLYHGVGILNESGSEMWIRLWELSLFLLVPALLFCSFWRLFLVKDSPLFSFDSGILFTRRNHRIDARALASKRVGYVLLEFRDRGFGEICDSRLVSKMGRDMFWMGHEGNHQLISAEYIGPHLQRSLFISCESWS